MKKCSRKKDENGTILEKTLSQLLNIIEILLNEKNYYNITDD